MSGGSFGYIYSKLDEAAYLTHDKEIKDLLIDLSKLLHDEEWYFSGDYREEQYIKSLAKFKKKWFKDTRKDRLKKYIDVEMKNVKNQLYEMIGLEIEDAED